ncbi:hypothetical protein [Actinomadura harenae]|uniref:Uncharacterized protein n=1 Tax=Actinomadura harenae TaxID=2483351 RepID=A0A3M2LUC5_9ACTN|nr:hypothetical protein [Actinomadura harenae]RMI40997.1 hypothetical protein EBO15_24625 [Actinomadura harenae]
MNRLLLAAYPKSFRARQGAELLTCLDEAYPGRSCPPPREIAALVRAGVRARARAVVDDASRPWWLDGVHLAALALAVLALAPYLQDVWHWALRIDPGQHAIVFRFAGWYPWAQGPGTQTRLLPYGLLPLICLVALLRGKPWMAVPSAAAMIYAGATIGGSTAIFGDEGQQGLGYYGLAAPITSHDLVFSGTLFAACMVLAVCRPGRLRRHSYLWLGPVALAMAVAGGLHIVAIGPVFQRGLFAVEVAALIVAWVATASTGDHRWLIPVTVVALVRTQAIVAQPDWYMNSLPSLVVILLLITPLPVLGITAQLRRSRTLLD